MKLTFFGAAKAVTGSCHCVEVRGKKILIDCGLQQGKDERDNTVLDFAPNYIDYVIVTHAHIDHSGRIPLLIKQGFQGQIFATRLTGELMSIMLQDSAHIQEMDAQWKNQKGKRAGRPPVEPLYTVADAAQVPEHLVTVEYGQIIELCEGVKIRFVDAGHLLGSASVEMWLEENGVEKKIVFSGDIGNHNQPIIRDPSLIDGADYVVMESTYGDRNHDPVVSYTAELAKIIDDTFSKGGNVIIPSFAVGRTQELLYFMREMKKEGLVKIFSGDLRGYLDDDALEVVKDGERLFTFPGLTMTESSEESKMLNMDKSSKVIISASGMCDAGRIRHHLKHNLWREECAIVFVGYQGEGTLGRHLLEGAKQVRLFGEDIAVNASIYNFKGLSSHADRDHLIEWIEHIQEPTPQQIFVVHGDAPARPRTALRRGLRPEQERDAGRRRGAAAEEDQLCLQRPPRQRLPRGGAGGDGPLLHHPRQQGQQQQGSEKDGCPDSHPDRKIQSLTRAAALTRSPGRPTNGRPVFSGFLTPLTPL